MEEFEFGFEEYVTAMRRATVCIDAGSLEEAKRKATAMAESGEMNEEVRYELEFLWDTLVATTLLSAVEEYYPGICNATNNQPTGDDDGKENI